MSRYVASSIVELEGGPDYGEVAYGFDHVVGPFFQRFDAQSELVEDVDYLSDRQFDCHALAEKLQAMVWLGDIESSVRLHRHIAILWLDMAI